MDLVKAREVVERYRAFLTSGEKTPLSSPRSYWALPHVCEMLDKMDGFLDEVEQMDSKGVDFSEVWEKFNRWLGFLQGVFYITGCYSLDEMRDHNRTD